MHTQTGETGQIWRMIGRLEATDIAILRRIDRVERDMRDIKSKGRRFGAHFSTMGLIVLLSILSLINPELAKTIGLKLFFKMVTG